jgi:hypothetical protein
MHTVRALPWGITVTAAARPASSERRRRDGPDTGVLPGCRDASGLAALMRTGLRAGLPGVSGLAAPAPPVADWAPVGSSALAGPG